MRSLLSLASLRGGCGPWFDRAGRGCGCCDRGPGLYSRKDSNTYTVPAPMPTKKPRTEVIPENMPSLLTEAEERKTVPAVYDGSRMKERDPVKYAGIVQDLAAGVAVSAIKKNRKVSLGTIAMVRAREKDLIEQGKVVVKGLTSMATISTLETILEKIEADKIPPGVLPILFGILRDKEVRDQGEATQKVEVTHRVSMEQVRANLSKLKRVEEVPAEALEIDALEGSTGPAGQGSAGGEG